MFRLVKSVLIPSPHITRKFCSGSQVYVLQNLYATKPSIRNQIKSDNFKSYEDLGKVKKFVFRELHADEVGLGPIPTIDEGAKCGDYKNPEYFSYHNYSFYDFELGMQCMHLPQPSSVGDNDLLTAVRKTCIGEVEDYSGRCFPPPNCPVEFTKESGADAIDPPTAKPEIEMIVCSQPVKDSVFEMADKGRPKTDISGDKKPKSEKGNGPCNSPIKKEPTNEKDKDKAKSKTDICGGVKPKSDEGNGPCNPAIKKEPVNDKDKDKKSENVKSKTDICGGVKPKSDKGNGPCNPPVKKEPANKKSEKEKNKTDICGGVKPKPKKEQDPCNWSSKKETPHGNYPKEDAKKTDICGEAKPKSEKVKDPCNQPAKKKPTSEKCPTDKDENPKDKEKPKVDICGSTKSKLDKEKDPCGPAAKTGKCSTEGDECKKSRKDQDARRQPGPVCDEVNKEQSKPNSFEKSEK